MFVIVTNTILEKLHEKFDYVGFSNDDIVLANVAFNCVPCFNDGISLAKLDVNNISVDNVNCAYDYPETIINVRLIAWSYRNGQLKACKNRS